MMNVDLKDAYLFAFHVASENPIYSPQLLQHLASLVMRRTGSEYSTFARKFDSSKGEFRLCNVSTGIGGSSYLAYNKVPRAVDGFCKWLNEEIAKVDNNDIAACYRLSFEAHFRLVNIHPFDDGNGRISRTLVDTVLARLDVDSARYYSMSAEINRIRKPIMKFLKKLKKVVLTLPNGCCGFSNVWKML